MSSNPVQLIVRAVKLIFLNIQQQEIDKEYQSGIVYEQGKKKEKQFYFINYLTIARDREQREGG